MKTISVSDLRASLKDVLEEVANGQCIAISQRGVIIAEINPASGQDEAAYRARVRGYQNGGVVIEEDIINAPLKKYGLIDEDIYSDSNIAAEPDV